MAACFTLLSFFNVSLFYGKMGPILPFSFLINLFCTGCPKSLWWFFKEAISPSQEASIHFGGLSCTLMYQVLSVLFSQAHIFKNLVSAWSYWSEQGVIWISTLSLPVANTQREKCVSLYFINIFPPVVWRIRILLTQKGWMCLMTAMGSSGSFVQLPFELPKVLMWPCVCHLSMWEEPDQGPFFILRTPPASFSQYLVFLF